MKNLFRSRNFHLVLSFGLSAALLIWLFYSVDWGGVAEVLKRIHYPYLIPCILTFVLHFYLRAYRWKFLLPRSDTSNIHQRFDAIMLGAFVSYILPLRAGEFVRPYLISKDSQTHFSAAMLSVVVERVFDLTAVLLTFGYLFWNAEGLPAWVNQGASWLGLIAIIISAFLLAVVFSTRLFKWVEQMVEVIVPNFLLPIARGIIKGINEGGEVLKDRKAMAGTIIFTIPVWLSCYYLYVFFFPLLAMDGNFYMATVVAVFIALAVAAPSAPGFIGVYQAGCIAAFTLFGVSLEEATAYALLSHFFQYLLIILYGGVALLTRGITFQQLASTPGKEIA